MGTIRRVSFAVCLLAISLILGNCNSDSNPDLLTSPLSQVSPLTAEALAPTPTLAPTPGPIQLTILHTNDNWGETEPCG
jgi:hypothetical protein